MIAFVSLCIAILETGNNFLVLVFNSHITCFFPLCCVCDFLPSNFVDSVNSNVQFVTL